MLKLYLIENSYCFSRNSDSFTKKNKHQVVAEIVSDLPRKSSVSSVERDKESAREGGGEYILLPCFPGP